MKIGIDAKRAFHNRTGLGNYSRDTIRLLAEGLPHHEWLLFNPKPGKVAFNYPAAAFEVHPENAWDKQFPSLWRHQGIVSDLLKNKVQLYHGLSAELPIGIENTGIKTLVTVHDLIYERFPDFYKTVDQKMYRRKTKNAAIQADKVLAISKMTKIDLINFYKIPEEKIEVVYQSCHALFQSQPDPVAVLGTKLKRNLPDSFLLNVGSIEPRKNLLTAIKAIATLPEIHLVAVGKRTAYSDSLQEYLREHQMTNRVHLLSDVTLEELHHLYHLAKIFIYPSLIEGFGIPLIEAQFCGLPIIASKGGCFAEAGGIHSEYVEPESVRQWKDAITALWNDEERQQQQRFQGLKHVEKFKTTTVQATLLELYRKFGVA